jgi:dienelactone hydrolase
MSEQISRWQGLAGKTVVYRIPGMESAAVTPDVPYLESRHGALLMDVYMPAERTSASLPVVINVMGYPDPDGRFRKLPFVQGWAQLIAASGMAAVLYGTREPASDILSLVQHIREHASTLQVDEHRIGLLASSGHVPVALSALMQDAGLRCAALLYGFTLDLDGGTGVTDAARAFGFGDACAGRAVEALPDVPLFLVRAGREQFAGLNEAMDRFIVKALARNLPITFVNYAAGEHAFDLDDDTPAARAIMEGVLRFLRSHLA